MPANEQTWREQKLLHIAFGASSLLMLLATIWMMANDHDREWKQYQRDFRELETRTAESRVQQQQSDEYLRQLHEYEQAVAAARAQVPPKSLIDEFEQEVERDAARRQAEAPNFSDVERNYKELAAAEPGVVAIVRDSLLEQLTEFVQSARFRENNLLTAKKFKAADFDVARSNYELGIGNGLPQAELDQFKQQTDAIRAQVEELTVQVQDASTHRKNLESIMADITAAETAARKKLDDHRQQVVRLETALTEVQDNWAKDLLEMPILDAFGRPVKIEPIWLPNLTINNNFRDVARFDRCTTCHQGIEKTQPGSASAPGYELRHELKLTMQAPAKPPEVPGTATPAERLKAAYGLQLSSKGLLNRDEVTVGAVRPESPAAKAKLIPNDVIASVGDALVFSNAEAYRYLLDLVAWGQPIELRVLRGVPHPFASHPRLDLFVSSSSPHRLQEFGCTICHEGQGSGTDFKWTSHTPNSYRESVEWQREHGWFNNHHWIYPMLPERHMESGCLKCHHNVSELEPSERFLDPPAPRLVGGFNLIKEYGCFGCHEINGYDGPNKRIGPDLRAEPSYAAAAQALLAQGELDEEQQEWARDVADHPDHATARQMLLASIRASALPPAVAAAGNAPASDEAAAAAGSGGNEKPVEYSDATKKLAELLQDVEIPGTLRKVGPSLRHLASKVDYEFLYSWVNNPTDFRPTTKMPRFFGLHEHLDGDGLKVAKRFEPVEVRGIAEYLLSRSQKFEFADRPEGVTEQPSAERGKKLFETRGCLACHKHKDFPQATMTQGPDLSRLAGKLGREANKNGPSWLYAWLRNPQHYHARTFMPNMLLDPLPMKDAQGKATNQATDPAADIAVYLLTGEAWQPKNVPPRELSADDEKALQDLALEHLYAPFTRKQAERIVREGIPESRRREIKGDEVELIGDDFSQQKLLLYVGRRAISKYGCSGCHDIPGYEDAKPIGTGLADWGRKTADKLAFELIAQFLTSGHGEHGGGHELDYADMDPDTSFYMKSLMSHERTGFIWQKLRAPRSYDYKKTENKGYNERLRMPKFNLTQDEIEQIITFVLGLVSEPPSARYVYRPTPRREALVGGQQVIDKFNCQGCHAFEMDRWELAFAPGEIRPGGQINDYDFLKAHFSPAENRASLEKDNRGLLHAAVVGTPVISDQTGKVVRIDEDGAPIDEGDNETKAYNSFQLWESTIIAGQVRPAGVQNVLVPESAVVKRYPAAGGVLPNLIYRTVVANERTINPQVKPEEAWGWLPPPLKGEGRKVQSDWLHDFLLEPFPVRPAVVLRMPKFNMSSDEASKLVNYFAAKDNAQFPYEYNPRAMRGLLTDREGKHLQQALKIITDNNYCVKCHLVGDYMPPGSDRVKGPRLDAVYKRMRPDYLKAWIANPKRLLPYTGMPVNIPVDKPVSQELYHGSSLDQVNAVVDLLMNYDRYAEWNTPISPMIKPPTATAEAPAAAPTGGF